MRPGEGDVGIPEPEEGLDGAVRIEPSRPASKANLRSGDRRRRGRLNAGNDRGQRGDLSLRDRTVRYPDHFVR